MLIQFDREDSENLVVTFDNSESDLEQMKDFIDWLEASGLEFNKLKMKIPGVSEKVTNLFVKRAHSSVKQVKQVSQILPAPISKQVTQVQPPAAVKEEEESETAHLVAKDISSDSESESEPESDSEPVSRTKKTTKRTTKSIK